MNTEEILKNSLLKNYHSDNVIIQTILTGIIITFTSFIFSNIVLLKKIPNRIINFFSYKKDIKAELEFNCTETKNYYHGSNMKGSLIFKSLLWLIKENIAKKNIFNLKYLKEYNENECYQDDTDSDEFFHEILYIVNQEDEFYMINENIGKIYFKFIQKDESSTDEGNKRNQKTYVMSIYSKTHTLESLQNFVEETKEDYIKNLNYIVNKKQFIFELDGISEDNDLVFTIYPFSTTCNINKIYFENKDKIMNQINFFTTNKEWYEKHGKPYTLGICSYGEPGCGKTSFEKCLAKKLNRHMIKVDLSKIKNKSIANKLFFSEKINDFKVPYDKRIYIFSEVDRMSDILYKDEYKKKNEPDNSIGPSSVIINNNSKNKNSEIKDTCKNKSDENELNLSHILDILDGIPERTGQIIMMSTNHFEKLDPALIRPGRIDNAIHFMKCTNENLIKLLKDYYNKENIIIDKDISNKWTPAQIFQFCSQESNINNVIKKLCN